MFGNMFGRSSGSAPASETLRPNSPAPAPAQPANPGPAPIQQAASQQVIQLGNQTTPVQPQASAPTQVQQPTQLQALLASISPQHQQPAVNAQQDPITFAANFLEALTDPASNPAPQQIAPRLNVDAIRSAFDQVDMTSGLDIGATLESLGGENGEESLRNLLQGQALNVITAMTPLVNRMVEQAVERAVQASITQTDHNMLSREIVSSFVERHPHASNPVSMQLLTNIANTIIAANPRNVNREQILLGLEQFMAGISAATNKPNPQESNIPQGAQTAFGGLFSSNQR